MHQIAHDRFHIATDVANFGKFCRFRLHKRRVSELGQATSDFGLTNACRSDHQNVLGGDFRVQRFGHATAAPTVAKRHSNGALGVVLTHNVFVEFAHDFARREHGAVGFVHLEKTVLEK